MGLFPVLALPLLYQGMGRTESIRHLQALAAISGKAASGASLEEWLEELAVYLVECMHASWMCLCLVDEDLGRRETLMWEDGVRLQRPSSAQQELCDQALNTGQAVMAAGDDGLIAAQGGWLTSDRQTVDIQAVAVPLIQAGYVHGALGVDRIFTPPIPWSEDMLVLNQVARCVLNYVNLHKRLQNLKIRNTRLLQAHSLRTWPLGLLGTSQAIYEVRQQVEQVAPAELPVLLQGETGTYKNVLARLLHEWSTRSQGPFVRVNCTLPASILEGELFGYTHTALPQSDVGQKGAFEAAEKGTLYLDQVNALPSRLQNRILRAVQDKTVERLGDHDSRRVDVRIMASSSTTLAHLVDKGLFRSELYYRINRFPIFLPPLRDRPEDIDAIMQNALHDLAGERGSALRLTPQALHLLKTHDWPGNVRELDNLVQRLALLAEGRRIGATMVRQALGGDWVREAVPSERWRGQPRPVRRGAQGQRQCSLQEMEKGQILDALRETNGVKRHAARLLGITERQINYRIRKYRLE